MRLDIIACKYTVFIPTYTERLTSFSKRACGNIHYPRMLPSYSAILRQLAISEMNLIRTRRISSSVYSSPNSSIASSILSVVDSLK